ncbi:MAG: hypothetical protein ISR82_07615 [Candidatus Marinimicrobia bacterium]|nr:hypothetical protein [Candidatus Neomarinimicrobiota bacterium]MBL7011074.1 hypothetical protein [Candidatus Neomarinimicrobiota bacterium]MBL7031112.1 hypothetical protein [Candidatus Neomarinimicrobiota bacterium]
MKFRLFLFILFMANIFAQTQVVIKDVMFMDAPYIGEVTTTTTKYAAEGLFRQESAVDVDRFLIRLAMGGNKIIGSILDGKTELRIVYNAKEEEYAMETFNTIRGNEGKPTLKGGSSKISFGSGSKNDSEKENEDPDEEESKSEYERIISESLEKVSGFEVRKVTTKIKSEDGFVLIEEWLTTDTTLFHFLAEVEGGLVASYGGKKRNNPRSFSESMLKKAEQEFESVPGRMIKYTMEMKDEDDGFKMVWEVKSMKEVPFNPSDFKVPSDYEEVDELD